MDKSVGLSLRSDGEVCEIVANETVIGEFADNSELAYVTKVGPLLQQAHVTGVDEDGDVAFQQCFPIPDEVAEVSATENRPAGGERETVADVKEWYATEATGLHAEEELEARLERVLESEVAGKHADE